MPANPQQTPIIYRATALPASPNATHEGIWLIKVGGDTRYRSYIINSAGVVVEQDAVTTAQLDLKANDNEVVKINGNLTVNDIKTFSQSPVVPNATNSNQAVNKGQMDVADTALQTQITNLQALVNNGTKVPVPIDCSTNPNYPASTKGDAYRVTVGGRIGGASGPILEPNDTIYCLTTSPSGTEAAVGSNFYIVQGNIDKATTSVHGTVRLATAGEVTAETTTAAVTTVADAKAMIVNNTKWGAQSW